MKLVGCLVVCPRCFQWALEQAEVVLTPPSRYTCLPFTCAFTPRNSFESRSVIRLSRAVTKILRVCARPEVTTTTIQTVPILMVHFRSSAKHPVKKNLIVPAPCYCIGFISSVNDIPPMFSNPWIIPITYKRNESVAQFNLLHAKSAGSHLRRTPRRNLSPGFTGRTSACSRQRLASGLSLDF